MNHIQLQHYLTDSAEKYPNKIALVCAEKRISYRELADSVTNIAKHFTKLGLDRGDRVVCALGNSLESVLIFWGVLSAGGVVCLINSGITHDKIKFILRDSGCKLFISTANIAQAVLSNDTPINLKYSIVTHQQNALPKTYIPFDFLLTPFNEEITIPKNIDIDLAAIIYTSGSTGQPKGVMLSHRNMLAASQSINSYLQNQESDVFLSALPLSFDYGLYQMIMAFSVGATLILEKDFLLPLRFLKLIENEKVTALPGVPTLFSILDNYSKRFKFDLSSVRYVTNTGSAIYQSHVDIIYHIFPNAKFYSMYGLTECKRCTYLPPQDLKRKEGSVGIAIPNTEMWVVDNHGLKLASNQLGQLVIRGSTVMQGYWNNPQETANRIKEVNGAKILFTGDYGYIDEEGYFYFKGRMDEMIKVRGEKISPKEIEEVIMEINGVSEAAVISVPSPEVGSSIYAYVSVKENTCITADYVMNFCRHKLERNKIPRSILFLPNLPKSSNGKIDKIALQKHLNLSESIAC